MPSSRYDAQPETTAATTIARAQSRSRCAGFKRLGSVGTMSATQTTAARPTKVLVVDCSPTSFVTRGRTYEVVGWRGKLPQVAFDHGPIGYLSSETIWREAGT